MNMFKSLLDAIPKNRSQFVNELEIPEVTLTPYIWREPEPLEECISERSDCTVPESVEFDRGSLSTDSSIPLSRAMTDSEIDYCRYKRMKRSNEAWKELKAVMDTFPSDYLASLNSYYYRSDSYDDLAASCARERLRRYTDDLKARLDKRYDDECRVFSSDDPGLEALEDATLEAEYDRSLSA